MAEYSINPFSDRPQTGESKGALFYSRHTACECDVLGVPLYEDTADGRAATPRLYSFVIEFGLAPMLSLASKPYLQMISFFWASDDHPGP